VAALGDGVRALVTRLRPEERIATIYFLAVAALHAGRGLAFTVVPIAAAYLQYLAALTVFALPPWIVLQLLRRRRGRFDRRAATADAVDLVRSLLSFLVVLVAYTNLKSRLLQLHPAIFDRQLARIDAVLHFGGGDLVGWLLQTNDNRTWLLVLGNAYFLAWIGLALPFAFAFARGGGAAARRILVALSLAYIVGGFLYLALPALGPAFVERARYAHLAATGTFQVQESMLAALRAVARDPASPAVAFFGIAAFPSLHLATTGLGLLAAGRWTRWLLWLLVPFNLLVAWSALVWGWHYAIDFYPGLLLAWGGWWAAERLPGLDERSEPLPSPS